MKNTLKIFNIFIAILIVILLTFWYTFFVAKKEYKNVSISAKKGTTISEIYKDLGLNYTIIDKIYFKIDSKLSNIHIGNYRLNGKLSKYEVLKKIKNGTNKEIKLTIPEGFTQKQVFARISALGLGNEDEINIALKEIDFPYPHENNNYEGYFYPETYIFSENSTTKEVLEKILEEFLKKFPVDQNLDKKKFYEQLILASIVEAEVNDDNDKEKVAGVFLKRIEIGMKLESDATLKYELGRQATKKELKEKDTKYNSYKVIGLPPTPIGNPSKDTVEAVKNPIITDDLFFFMYNGKTYYSKTHEEHLKKRKESGQLK